MKLLIRNIARTTTEAELRAIFEAYGKVQSCTLVMDKATGKSKGFGFVEMPKPGDAKAARKNLNGKDVAGSKIRVKNADAKPAESKQSEPEQARSKKPEPKQPESKPPGPKKKPAFNPWTKTGG